MPLSIRDMLAGEPTIAVVGLSPNPDRPSHGVARYLLAQGFHIIPVTPVADEILGLRCYPDLRSVPEPIDIVDCFRRPEEIPALAADAIAIGARVLWMQRGISHPQARALAEAAGLTVIEDRCLKVEHARLASASASWRLAAGGWRLALKMPLQNQLTKINFDNFCVKNVTLHLA